MSFDVKVLKHSVSPDEIQLTSLQLRYPRADIHEEFLTHRSLSRSSSSSRAIPVESMIDSIVNDPAIPYHWGKNQKGMQAEEECNQTIKIKVPKLGWYYKDYCAVDQDIAWEIIELDRESAWFHARDKMVEMALQYHNAGYHKQVVNLLLRPWEHIDTIVSSTEWANFYALRRHPSAKPGFKHLADMMHEVQQASEPTLLQPGMWHLPYVGDDDFWPMDDYVRYQGTDSDDSQWDSISLKMSTARNARVSYRNHDGSNPNIDKDIVLHDSLVVQQPLHATPAEHCATPDTGVHTVTKKDGTVIWRGDCDHQWGNFVGWRQYRKTLPNECVKDR